MKTMKTILVTLMIMLTIWGADAQTRGFRIRERILQAKLNEIQKSLQLSQPTMERFSPIYTAYEKELAGINFREQGGIMRANPDSLTAEEAERRVMMQLDHAQKLIDIRKKYYPEFKTALTPQQIIKLYQTEAEIRRKVMQELRRRFGGRFN